MRAAITWWAALAAGLLLQTTLFPGIFADPWRPDVTRALVLWVALTGAPRGGPLLAFGAGLLVDLSSGAPLGFTAALRLSVYAAARPFRGFFFADHPIFLVPLAVLGAVVDAAAAAALSPLIVPGGFSIDALIAIGTRQAIVDAFWVPVVFVALELAGGRTARGEAAI